MTTRTTPDTHQAERDEAIRAAVGRLDSPADIRVVGQVRARDDYASLGFGDMLDALAAEASALALEAEIAAGTADEYLSRIARKSPRPPTTSTTTAGAAAEAKTYRQIVGRCHDYRVLRDGTGRRPGAPVPARTAEPAATPAPVAKVREMRDPLVIPGAAEAMRHLPRRVVEAIDARSADTDPAVLPGALDATRNLPRL